MKRFTETSKWEDPWFRRLPIHTKALWCWLLDKCDNAGVIDADLDLASFQIGYQYPMDSLSSLGERVVKLECGKHFIPKFIEFQYGTLSRDCKAHNPIFQSLSKHGLEGYPKGINTLQEKETEKEGEKETDQVKEKPKKRQRKEKPEIDFAKARGTLEDLENYAAEIGLEKSDGAYFFHMWEGNGWTKNKGQENILDWKATFRAWKVGKFFPSQRQDGQSNQIPPNEPRRFAGEMAPTTPFNWRELEAK